MPLEPGRIANPAPTPQTGGATPDPKAGAAATSAAAPSKPAAGTSTSSGTAAASSSASPAPGDAKVGDVKSGDAAKPDEKPVRTAAVILAEREARLTEDRRAHKTEAEKLAADRKAHEADVAFARKVLDAAKGKSRLAVIDLAAENAGLTREQFLEALQDEYLGGLKEPTADEKIARTVEQQLAAERKKADDERKAANEAETKKQQEAGQAAYDGYCEAVQSLAAELGPKFAEDFDLCNTFNVTPRRVADKALELWKASGGKTPTPREALQALEEELAATVGKSKKFRAAEAPKTEEKQDETAGDRAPGTLTSRTRSVPIVPKPTGSGAKLTPFERLAEARRDIGDVGN